MNYKNTLITTLNNIRNEFSIQFEVKPSIILRDNIWTNVLHFTNASVSSDGTPVVWFHKGKIQVVFSSITRSFCESDTSFQTGTWISVRLTQVRDVDGYTYKCQINGKVVKSILNKYHMQIPNVKVYMSNYWDEMQPGLIRNLSVFNYVEL